jgi:HSP20 family protein
MERNMANLTRYDPIGEIFDDLFKGFVVRPVSYDSSIAPTRQFRMDVSEQNGEYKVLAELPGVKKDDIRVSVDGDQVSISAESRVEKEVKDGERVLHSERQYGKVARSFRLAQEVDQANVKAKFTDGVLELVLPKKATAAAKQITIQ